jgi:ribose transport system substrate-binding protein
MNLSAWYPIGRRAAALAILLASILALAGCKSADKQSEGQAPGPQTTAPAASTGGKLIAIVSPAKTSEFHNELPKGAADEAQKLGWPAIIDKAPSTESDYTGQVALVQDIIQQHPAAMSVCGINPQALNSIIQKANTANIPVFVHNQITTVPGAKVVAYIGYNERKGGALCGAKAADLLKQKNGDYKGTVAILLGEPGTHTDERAGGFKDALKQYPGIQVVAELNGKWERAPGTSITQDWLEHYQTLDLVFGCSDAMAQGASEAAQKKNHPLFTIGIDGNSTALQDVKEGKLTATLAVQPRMIGAKIVDTMADYFKSGKVPQTIETECVIVDKSNVAQFVK